MSKRPKRRQTVPLLMALTIGAIFPTVSLADVTVTEAWARATPPAARTAAVYFTLVNDGEADVLIGADTDASDLAELHTHVHKDGMMLMQQVKGIDVPTDGKAVLEPNGNHLMLVSLRRDLEPGQTLTLTLRFESQAPTVVEVPVRDARQ